MSLETLAFWYVRKRLYQMADTGEVCFAVIDSNGDQVALLTLTNDAWRKSKVALENKDTVVCSLRVASFFRNILTGVGIGKIIGNNHNASTVFVIV
jgi:hypothetical protein